ncbi:MAG: hypothetical protein HY699_19500 [Deltaproteobacteria bacterium]|nr:hypothetical protein [Deltaproteobacteria bacterium]
MWRLLEDVAGLERRVGALYERYAELFQHAPQAAAFWREMAGEERVHALVVAAAREVFPATAPALPGEWTVQLKGIERLLGELESRAGAGLALEEAFAAAEELEATELNTVTQLIVRHAGRGFARLGPLVNDAGVDQHHQRMAEARRRFCAA